MMDRKDLNRTISTARESLWRAIDAGEHRRLGPVHFAYNFQTVVIGMPRGSGKTQSILDTMSPTYDTYITMNETMRREAARRYGEKYRFATHLPFSLEATFYKASYTWPINPGRLRGLSTPFFQNNRPDGCIVPEYASNVFFDDVFPKKREFSEMIAKASLMENYRQDTLFIFVGTMRVG